MNIYLAGKIGKNDWRHTIVDGLGGECEKVEELAWSDAEQSHGYAAFCLPRTISKSIFGVHDYAGPYFVRLDEHLEHDDDCLLKTDPGGHCCNCGMYSPLDHKHVVGMCFEGIDNCDVLFAWLDEKECHGTAMEIGYARGIKKDVVICRQLGAFFGDCILPSYAGHIGNPVGGHDYAGPFFAKTPREGLLKYLRVTDPNLRDPALETPASFVYFIEAVGLDRIKIGKADDVGRRLQQLKTGSPCALNLIKAVPGGHSLEAKLHSEFAGLRIKGEWFHAGKSLTDYIASLEGVPCLK